MLYVTFAYKTDRCSAPIGCIPGSNRIFWSNQSID